MSADKGATWSVVFPGNSTFEPFPSGSGCYTNTIAVLPTDPYQVLLGGANLWYGYKFQPTGYFNWEEKSFGKTILLDPSYAPSYHHDYAFRPNSNVQFAIATDNGISIGTDNAGEFTFQTSNKNLITAQMNSVAMGREGKQAIGGGVKVGTQIFGGPIQNEPENGTQIWLTDNLFADDGGTGGTAAWSVINPNTVIYSKIGVNPPLRRSDDFGGTFSSTFLGGTSPDYTGGLTSGPYTVIPFILWENVNYTNTHDSVKIYARVAPIEAGSTIVARSSNAKFEYEYLMPVSLPLGDSLMIPDYVQTRFFIYGTKSSTPGIYMTKEAIQLGVDPDWFYLSQTDTITCMALSTDMDILWAGAYNGKLYRISNLNHAYDSTTANSTSSGLSLIHISEPTRPY
jgi:hypothetical protein